MDPRDPPLSEAGQTRAAELAALLGDAGIDAIYATDTQRTRQTAAPLAAALGLEVRVYDASDLAAFAAHLRADVSQTVLVVGHSNTTPTLAQALGGESGLPIDEAREYDRLYVIDLTTGASRIDRYGVLYRRP